MICIFYLSLIFYLLVHYSFFHLSAKLNVQVRVITSYGNVFSFFLCVYIIAFCYIYVYLIYEGHLLLFTYDLLSLSIYSYYFILFFFYLLYISFIYFFLSLFFVSIYFSLYILFICFLYSLIFSFKDFLLCPPRKFYFCFLLLVCVYGYKFVLSASYKKRSSIPEPLLYFIFLRSLDAAAKSSASLSFCSLFSIACSKVLARALNHFPPLLTATTNLSSLSSQWMFRIPSSRDSPDC